MSGYCGQDAGTTFELVQYAFRASAAIECLRTDMSKQSDWAGNASDGPEEAADECFPNRLVSLQVAFGHVAGVGTLVMFGGALGRFHAVHGSSEFSIDENNMPSHSSKRYPAKEWLWTCPSAVSPRRRMPGRSTERCGNIGSHARKGRPL
jgi:hypothetical protein